jgi:hypothetical protein
LEAEGVIMKNIFPKTQFMDDPTSYISVLCSAMRRTFNVFLPFMSPGGFRKISVDSLVTP